MRLEIPLNEIRDFLSDHYRVDIGLRVAGEKKVAVNYIDSVLVTIDKVKENVIYLSYKIDGLAVILMKVARMFLKTKPDSFLVEWNSKTKEIILDLNKIPKLEGFLKFAYVSEVQFVNDSLLLLFYVRNKI